MADKSAYVPVEAACGAAPSGKSRPAELDDFDGDQSATPPPPVPAAPSSARMKHAYQKTKSYQKTYPSGKK